VVVPDRGEIWWASLPEPEGSGPGGRRPVVVIQSDVFNRSAIGTTIVAIVTSNLSRAEAPGNVLLTTRQSGLSKDSVVNVSQLFTLDKTMLTERVGALSAQLFHKIEDGLRRVLDL
jgi:mRNA interferase MazF